MGRGKQPIVRYVSRVMTPDEEKKFHGAVINWLKEMVDKELELGRTTCGRTITNRTEVRGADED